jgi:hypothetical protein
MRIIGAETLQPVLKFLDGLIAQYGHLFYMGLVNVSIPLIAWILCGGLRRRNADRPPHIRVIVIHQSPPPPRSPPLLTTRERVLPTDDGENSFAT